MARTHWVRVPQDRFAVVSCRRARSLTAARSHGTGTVAQSTAVWVDPDWVSSRTNSKPSRHRQWSALQGSGLVAPSRSRKKRRTYDAHSVSYEPVWGQLCRHSRTQSSAVRSVSEVVMRVAAVSISTIRKRRRLALGVQSPRRILVATTNRISSAAVAGRSRKSTVRVRVRPRGRPTGLASIEHLAGHRTSRRPPPRSGTGRPVLGRGLRRRAVLARRPLGRSSGASGTVLRALLPMVPRRPARRLHRLGCPRIEHADYPTAELDDITLLTGTQRAALFGTADPTQAPRHLSMV